MLPFLFAYVLFFVDAKYIGPPTHNATLPFWLLNAPFQYTRTGSLPSDDTVVDITIIGSGISGSSITYYLSQYLNEQTDSKKTSVLLLDARGAAGGASSRNAGAMHVQTDPGFQRTANLFGNQTAISYYNFTLDTTKKVFTLLNETNPNIIQSGSRCETIYDSSSIPKRNQSIHFMQSFGYGLTEQLLSNSTLIQNMLNSSDNSQFVGGVYGPFAYSLNPAQIVFDLIAKSILNTNNTMHLDVDNKMNLNIQYNTVVHSVKYDNNNEYYVMNITQDEQTKIVKSNIVAFATNGYTSYLLPQFMDFITPSKNQIIISKPYENFDIWNAELVGIMSINSSSGILNSGVRYYGQYKNFQDRVLILGTPDDVSWNNDCNDSYLEPSFSVTLNKFLMNDYPQIEQMNGLDIDMQWQGVFANSGDGYPLVGPIENMTNAYICAAFSGMGLSQALNAGKAIAAMIVGEQPSPFVDILLPAGRL